ncbi:MAG: hypothetical protein JJT76_00045 [Clostridiaceae bacterium]|nr:hypothetical protein [Clostridiaceae bacterium]
MIEGGKIRSISSSPFDIRKAIDAKGLYVCPGFVDMHIHEEPYDEEKDTFQTDTFISMLRMGVTTAIGGNCGGDRYKEVSGHQILEMRADAGHLLDIGCLGISYGIRYIPGITKEEMMTISQEAVRTETFIAAHIRDDAKKVFEAAEELLLLGKELEVAVHFSHIGSMADFGQMRGF